MPSTINAQTAPFAAIVQTADSTGDLALQTANVTALTINSSQVVSLANALPVASGGTGNTTGASRSLATTNWTISESGGKLFFAFGGVNKGSLDSSGNFIVTGNVTAFGTP